MPPQTYATSLQSGATRQAGELRAIFHRLRHLPTFFSFLKMKDCLSYRQLRCVSGMVESYHSGTDFYLAPHLDAYQLKILSTIY